ncbi:MAG: hypothetical protein AAGH42_02160 [Pseudomonadota bacterium]
MSSALLAEANRSFGANDPSLAVGLSDIAFYSTELPFINLFHQGGDRHTNDGAWSINVTNADGTVTNYDYSEAWHAGFLDQNGNVANLPDGASASIFFLNGVTEEAQTGGRYVLLYEGEGDFRIVGANAVAEESAPGRLVLDLIDGSPFGLIIEGTTDGDHLRDFALVREEHEGLYDAGALFNPDFIELFDDHRTIRFMDWMETNHSNHINFDDIATLESQFFGIPANQAYEYVFAKDVPELTAETIAGLTRGPYTLIYVDPQTGEPFRDGDTGEILIDVPPELLPSPVPSGVPLQAMIALANQIGADPWFNIPHQATDDFVRQFAEMVRDNLDPGLVAHFEFSNETWNAQFEQFGYLNDRGRDAFGDEYGDFPVNIYYGYRAAEIQSIIDDVFGEEADARVHNLLATQTFNTGVADQAILGVQRFINETDPTQSVDDLFDSLAVTGYFGQTVGLGSEEYPSILAVVQSWVDESNARFARGETSNKYEYFIEQVITDLQDGSLVQAHFQEAFDNGEIAAIPRSFSIAELQTAFAANQSIAAAFGLELIQYEGGSHFLTDPSLFANEELQEFINAANDSDAITQIYAQSVDVFRAAGGTLANDFVGVAQQSQFGSFGTLQNLNDQTAVFNYYNDYNVNGAATYGTINQGRDLSAFQHGTNISATDGDDTIIGSSNRDFLAGEDGDDILVGGAGNDGIGGGAGTDTAVFNGTRADYTISAVNGGVEITGIDGTDFLSDVEIISFSDDEAILVETFLAGASLDVTFHGGGNFRAVSEIVSVGFTISALDPNLQTAQDLGATDIPLRAVDAIYYLAPGIVDQARDTQIQSGIDNVAGQATFIGNVGTVTGSGFNDWFIGYDISEYVNLSHGDDRFDAGGGDDTLIGDTGSDTINGGDGNDVINAGIGNDSVDGGAGNDTFILSSVRDDYAIEVAGDGFQIVGVDGTDFIRNVEFVQFGDGLTLTVNTWVTGRNENVDYLGGADFSPSTASTAGLVIAGIDSETTTGDELGLDPNLPRTAQTAFYYAADRGNSNASYEAVHDFGSIAAAGIAELFSEVGVINGSAYDDLFEGTEVAETVATGAGADRLLGADGDDLLDGGDGNDFVAGGNGDDTLIGGAGDDTLNGGSGDDIVRLSGSIENYTISEQGTGFSIIGLDGTDFVIGVEFVEFGDGQVSTLSAWVSNAVVGARNLNGNPLVSPNAQAGVFIGAIEVGSQTANDLGIPTAGYDSFGDTVYFVHALDNQSATYSQIHNGIAGALQVADIVTGVGAIIGSNAGDVIEGSTGNEIVDAGAGDDILDGFSGDDTLSGGEGDDFIGGGIGDDVLNGDQGNDTLFGGAGMDQLSGGLYHDDLNGGADADTISGGAGFDTLRGDDGNDMLIGGANADNLFGGNGDDGIDGGAGLDHAFGGDGNDIIFGGGGNDLLHGEGGNDTLNGDAENDRIFGGNGQDDILGGDGNDLLDGGSGFDTLNGGEGNDTLLGGSNADLLSGGSGSDRLFGNDGLDHIFGGFGNDLVEGGAGNDAIFGGAGDDTLSGGAGDDRISGDKGDDQISGDAGNDRLLGGSGNEVISGGDDNDHLIGFSGFDTLIGGAGDDVLEGRFNADLFVFADGFGVDEIRDFDALNALEKIDLADVSDITDFADLMANHLQVDANGVVRIVVGTDSITLTGVSASDLDASDFIF